MLREGKPMQKTTDPPDWGLGIGPRPSPIKNVLATETKTGNFIITVNERSNTGLETGIMMDGDQSHVSGLRANLLTPKETII